MFIASTAFSHKEIHKYTWTSSDDLTLNQIDHILVDRRHRNNIMNIRSYRGANVDSDHILVRSRVRFRMCKNFFQKKVISSFRLDISKLKKQNILNEYKHKLSNNLGLILEILSYDFNWKMVKEIHKRNHTKLKMSDQK